MFNTKSTILRNTVFAAVATASLALFTPAGHAATIVYDLNTDWSNTVNPGANGVWSYNDGAGAITTHQASYPVLGNPAQTAWAATGSGPGIIVSWFKTISDYNTSTAGAAEYGIGDIGVHTWDPANGANSPPANLTWTAASDAMIDITGSIWHAHNTTDHRAADWTILINGTAVTAGLLHRDDGTTGATPFDFASGSGGAGVLDDVAVLAGDVVELRMETNTSFGTTAGSFLGINLTVTATTEDVQVPAPGGIAMLGLGLIGLYAARRRKTA